MGLTLKLAVLNNLNVLAMGAALVLIAAIVAGAF
jgi:hypothetical protein